jgi:hypothetical protein
LKKERVPFINAGIFMGYQQSRFAIRRSAYLQQTAIAGAVTVIFAVIIFISYDSEVQKGDWWKLVIFVLLVLLGIFEFVAMPLDFELTQDGVLKFRSYLKTRAFPMNDLTEITIEKENGGLTFRFEKANIKMSGAIDGLPEFFSIIRTRMPNLVIREV